MAKEEVAMQDIEKGEAKPAEEAKEKKMVSLFTLLRFTSHAERFMIILGIIGGIGHGVIQPLFIQIFGSLIDSFSIPADPSEVDIPGLIKEVNNFLLILVYLAIGVFFASYLQMAMFNLIGNSQANKIRHQYLRAIMRQEVGWFDMRTSGELTSKFSTGIPRIRDGLAEHIGSFFMHVSMVVAGLVVSFNASWKVALVTMGAMPAMVITFAFIGRIFLVYSNKGDKAYAKAGSVSQEVISSIKTVMIFAGYKEDEERYAKALEESTDSGKKRGYMEALSVSIPFLIAFGIISLAFWYGSTLVYAGQITAGKVMVGFMAVMMAGIGLGMMSPNVIALSHACTAGADIFEVIDRKSEIDNLSTEGKKLEKCTGQVSFKDIRFVYPSRPDTEVLKGVSFEVPSGKTVALVGKSGSGKSTSIGLLERFYNPKEGSVTLDGVDIREINISWLRTKIGHVGQEPVLFVGTIAENIGLGKEKATMEEIVEASKLANAYDFISQLPEGFNTMVQARGQNLSGGQKQRIAIARALIKNPQILLLDEATSALDSKSERIVQAALEKAQVGRTTLVVAHRLSTIRNADTILVFDQGKILESGNHDELMAKNGEYAKLVALQSLSSKKEEAHEKKEDLAEEIIEDIEPKLEVKVDQADEDVKLGKKRKPINRMYSEHWKIQWKRLVPASLVAILSGGIFPVISWVFTKVILTLMLQTGETLKNDAVKWCGTLVGVGAAAAVVHYIQGLLFLHAGEEFMAHLRKKVFSNVIRQKAAFFDEKGHEPAVFTNTLAQEIPLLPKVTGKLVGSVIKVIAAFGISMGIAFNANWKLAIVMTVCIPLQAIGNYARIYSIKHFAVATRKAYEKSGVVASEAVENIRTVFSLSLEGHFLDKYYQEILEPEMVGKKDSHAAGLGMGYAEAIQNLIQALAFWYGAKLIAQGEVTIEGMFLTTMIVINLGSIVGEYLNIFSDYQQAAEAAKEICKLLDSPREYDETMMKGDKLEQLEGNIEFKDVEFAYPTRSHQQILRGFTLSVKSGQTVALVGHSGCGKSTTISLVEKLYEYTGGSIKIDGAELSKLHTGWFRSKMGFVGQEPIMFARTIKENILYGFEASDEQMIAAAKKANAHDFISSMTDGYNTYVGERGGQLSGGQKQRVAIARALVRDPKILLLDEATSALDSESEKLVQAAINEARKGRTTLVIAHRLSTIKDADVIVVVNKGQVEEIGNHESLLEKGGAYFHFVQSQSLDSQE